MNWMKSGGLPEKEFGKYFSSGFDNISSFDIWMGSRDNKEKFEGYFLHGLDNTPSLTSDSENPSLGVLGGLGAVGYSYKDGARDFPEGL